MKNQAAYIYVIKDGRQVKIGSSVDPQVRWKRDIRRGTLEYVSPPHSFGRQVERICHQLLRWEGKRVKDEWYFATVPEAVAIIDRATRIADGKEVAPVGASASRRVGLISVAVDYEIVIRLRKHVKASKGNISKASAVEAALREYLDQRNVPGATKKEIRELHKILRERYGDY